MAKQVKPYFAHDFGARNDPKMQSLLMEMGYEGLGIYWALIEALYEQGGYVEVQYIRPMAYAMRIDREKLEQVLTGFELFGTDGEHYWSDGVLRRLAGMEREAEKRSAAGRRAIAARWESKDTEEIAETPEKYGNNTNVYERNTNVYGRNTEEYGRNTDVSSNDTSVSDECTGVRGIDTDVCNDDTGVSGCDTKKIKEIKEIKEKKEKKECVCDSHTPAHTHEGEEIFENFKNWCDQKAPLAMAFKEPLTLEGFWWLYRKYGGEKLKQCASDLHAKSAPVKNRNALNAFKKFIDRL